MSPNILSILLTFRQIRVAGPNAFAFCAIILTASPVRQMKGITFRVLDDHCQWTVADNGDCYAYSKIIVGRFIDYLCLLIWWRVGSFRQTEDRQRGLYNGSVEHDGCKAVHRLECQFRASC